MNKKKQSKYLAVYNDLLMKKKTKKNMLLRKSLYEKIMEYEKD